MRRLLKRLGTWLFVQEGARFWKILAAIEAMFAILQILAGHYLQAATTVLFVFVILTFLSTMKIACRTAWLKGRTELLNTLAEARQRGLSPVEFVQAEIERVKGSQ